MAGADQGERFARGEDALDQQLDPAAGLLAPGEARLDHPRVVQDQAVALVDQAGQVGKGEVLEAAVGAQAQQAARAALRGGVLGDERGRQRIVELGNEHPRQL